MYSLVLVVKFCYLIMTIRIVKSDFNLLYSVHVIILPHIAHFERAGTNVRGANVIALVSASASALDA